MQNSSHPAGGQDRLRRISVRLQTLSVFTGHWSIPNRRSESLKDLIRAGGSAPEVSALARQIMTLPVRPPTDLGLNTDL